MQCGRYLYKHPDFSGQPHHHIRDAMKILDDNHFVCVSKLGFGSFGDVCKMIDLFGREVAVKIVPQEVARKSEIEIWPKLSHPNIIPLLLNFHSPNVAIFVMPIQRNTLLHTVLDRHFFNQSGALGCLKSWLHGTLCGLNYLHSNETGHLDLKADNVLISYDNRAVISDFTFLASTSKAIPRSELGLPYIYRPPEAFESEAVVEGKAFDLWAYGMMVLELLTNQAFGRTSSYVGSWQKDIYPNLFSLLQFITTTTNDSK
nr:serine/threonine-protein kinase PAK mbt-like [Parasteatoda tepidariorum]